MRRGDENVERMYGEEDLAEDVLFAGGFINFGYWRLISSLEDDLTDEQRIEASVELYGLVFARLQATGSSRVLEVGCGRGNGCALLHLRHRPQLVVGVDMSTPQARRAQALHRHLDIVNARAEDLPFRDRTFTHIHSVEAAQHFLSIDSFASEANRVLRLGGRLVVTTFFATCDEALRTLSRMIPTVKQNIDRIVSIQTMLDNLLAAGLTQVEVEKIGEYVFPGYERWVTQREKGGWSNAWYRAYRMELLDYFLITATKG